MQAGPHDGVAADAVPALSTPAVPTPPTKASVAATESTLLLMDMDDSSLGTPPAVPCARLGRAGPRSTRRSDMSDPLGTLPAHGGLIRTGTADPIGVAVLERESPGQARKSRLGSKPVIQAQ